MTDMSKEAMKLALEGAANYIDALGGDSRKYRQSLSEQPAPVVEPRKQDPVACSVCDQVHSILDGHESKIIRNAKDGYPDGRSPRILTLQDRVMALCLYASDWKRWCLEKENTSPPTLSLAQRKPLTDQEIVDLCDGTLTTWEQVRIARAIEAKLKEKNSD